MPFEKALACPHCEGTLTRQKLGTGFIYTCLSCGGYAANIPVLENAGVTEEFVKQLWKATRSNDAIEGSECPHCGKPMTAVIMSVANGSLTLDICLSCQVVWLDKDEFAKLPKKPPPIPEKELSHKAKIALMKAELEGLKERRDMDPWASASGGKTFLGILGLPINEGDKAAVKTPYVTIGLVITCVLIYIFTFSHLKESIAIFSFIPNQLFRFGGLTIISSFFMHGNLFHLLFNMYFLLIFGNGAENRLGRWRFIELIFFSHLAGLLLAWVLFPKGDMQIIGASAGITGIMGYYAIAFPNAKISFLWGGMMWGLWWLRLPVFFYIILFVMGQFMAMARHFSSEADVANLAHLAGIAVGLIWGAMGKQPERIIDNKLS